MRSPAPLPSAPQRISLGIACALFALFAAAAIAVYSNSFTAPFIFDGELHVVKEPSIRRLWPTQAWLVESPRVLATFTFALNYCFDGLNVPGYHALNLAIHLAAALVLFGIVRRTLARPPLAQRYGPSAFWLALAVGLVWLVHPLETESVTYLYQRYESLMGLFYLLTLYGFVRSLDARRPAAWQAAAVVWCACGMASKEVMITAPLAVLWYDRVFVAASWREIMRTRWRFYAGLAATWVLLALLMETHGAQYGRHGIFDVTGVGPLDYARTQCGVILHYLRLCFWPAGLCLDYDWPVASGPWQYAFPLPAMAALLFFTVWLMDRHPRWGFLAGSFFLVLAPTSSVVPIADMAFEHRMYLPLASVVAIAILAAYELALRISARFSLSATARRALWAVPLALVVAAFGFLTYQRNEDYRTKIEIWSDTAAKSPKNYRARHNLGAAYLEAEDALPTGEDQSLRQEKANEAFRQFDAMIEILKFHSPRKAIPFIAEVAWMRATSPDPARRNGAAAVAVAQSALQLSRRVAFGEPECLDTLAAAYAESGQFDDAVSSEEKAIEVATKQHKLRIIREATDRLALYRAGLPFREKLPAADRKTSGANAP